ncbi:MAG TPA: MFS transporter [Vicinamibacteria bacterium]|nr:MFS transporter [Vicinamibacteria bacterium]
MRETLALLRRRPAFARLWIAEVISLGGDWFTLVALSVAVVRASQGSGLALGALIVTQLLPMVVLGPWSGALVDRFDRRGLLVASDLARVLVVLAFIPASSSGRLLPLYALALLHFSVATVFEPGRAAILPSLVDDAELVRASTLSSVTWSVMAAVGGLASGTLLAAFGMGAAFLVDAASFLISAMLILSIRRHQVHPKEHAGTSDLSVGEGLAYLRRHPVTLATLLVKTILGIATVDAFMIVFATRVFPWGDEGALSLGLAWASFGMGAILGPLVLNRVNDGSTARMRRFVTAGSALLAAALLALAAAPSLAVFALAILLRGAGGSSTWTFSTILLQRTVPERLRGRLFGLELASNHLAAMLFSLLWGALMDRLGIRHTVLAAGLLSAVPFAVWASAVRAMDRREAHERAASGLG